MEDNELSEAADRLLAEAEKVGIAIGKVKEGHIMVFTKAHLVGILGKIEAAGSDKCVVLVKDRSKVN